MMNLEKGKCCISPFPCLGGSSKNGMRFYSFCVAVYQQGGALQGLGMRLCCGGCRLGAIFGGNLFSIRFLRGYALFRQKTAACLLIIKSGKQFVSCVKRALKSALSSWFQSGSLPETGGVEISPIHSQCYRGACCSLYREWISLPHRLASAVAPVWGRGLKCHGVWHLQRLLRSFSAWGT